MPPDPVNDCSYPPPAVAAQARRTQMTSDLHRHAPRASDLENAVSHTFLLWVLGRWWSVVIPAGLVLAGIAAALVVYFYIPKYSATALLQIDESAPFVAFSSNDQGGRSERYIQTQLELIRSRDVLERVLGRNEIAAMPELNREDDRATYLQKQLQIKQVGRSGLYEVAFTSRSAQDAANVVNAIVSEYMKTHADDEYQRSQVVIELLEKERLRRSLEVERLRKNVVNLAKEVTGRDPFGGNEVTDFNRALSPVGAIFQSLTAADVDREVRRAQLQSLLDSPNLVNVESTGLIDLEVDAQETVRMREAAIRAIELDMERVKADAVRYQKNPQWESDPKYISLKSERDQRVKDLADEKAKVRKTILATRKEKLEQDRTQQITQMKLELESLDMRRKKLGEQFEAQVKQLQTGGAKSVELEFAKAELEREGKVYDLISSRKLALQTELRAPERVKLRQKAQPPLAPREPIPYKLLLLFCSAAFAMPFGLAVVREITVRRISDTEQLAQDTGLRVLGEVAALPVRYVAISPNQLSGRLRRDTYVFAESVNSLRTNLALANGKEAQVYAVTSAAPSEGKSSVAVSLALSIANSSSAPTLIIDGDMRSPFIASMLKVKNQPGLFEVLSKKSNLDAVIQKVGQGNELYAIPAGRATRSTHSVVDMEGMTQLLAQLRDRFSTIILDTPPILGASESLVLSRVADAVLFCALANTSQSRQIRLAIDRLEHAHVNLAGAVLSGMPARRYEYVYGYYANRIEAQE